MPFLGNIPQEISEHIFEPGGETRPGLTRSQRVLLKVLNLPFGSSRIAQKNFRKAFGLHEGTSFIRGFKCLSGSLFVGKNVGLCDTFFVDYAPIYIGDNVGFSYRNMVITSKHDPANFQRIIARSIIIEKNVWITTNVTILGGVRIGENSIIGAGSVVTRDIPPNVFAAGNPCKVIKPIERG
jgi:maltose O-acetyltransferase